jgi:hypothetical protein
MDGQLIVESAAGQGATILIVLPYMQYGEASKTLVPHSGSSR